MDPYDSKTRPSSSISRAQSVAKYWNQRSVSVKPTVPAKQQPLKGFKIPEDISVQEVIVKKEKALDWTETKLFENWVRLKDRKIQSYMVPLLSSPKASIHYYLTVLLPLSPLHD